MQNKIAFIFLMLLLLNAACTSSNFKTSDSGLEYKFILENRAAIQAKIGDILTLQLRIEDKDGKVIEESAVFKTPLQKSSHSGGSIDEALALMHKGDSAVFNINAINYYTQTRRISAPPEFSTNDKLTFYIKILDIVASEEYKKDMKLAQESNKREEEILLKEYLKEHNVVIEPTMSGLYFLELKSGTGPIPSPGKKVTVHYKGTFIDGSSFDSSYERNEPFEFSYGIGQVIQGWDEGVAHMRVGGKYKLIIPSYLAYGDKPRGPIPPNSTLIFEIELLHAEE